jgi:cold shock CspA family protein
MARLFSLLGRARSRNSAPLRISGHVKWFQEGPGYGVIKVDFPSMLEGEKEVFVHTTQIADIAPLLRDEPVEFEATETADGFEARKVVRLEERHNGVVKEWLDDKHSGSIQAEHGERLSVHENDIVVEGPAYLEAGEQVDFAAKRTDKGLQAIRVRARQSRYALERFAETERLHHGPLIEDLAEMAQTEDWSALRDRSKRKHPILFDYVLQTLGRVVEQHKLREGVTVDGMPFVCANTGLLTEQQEEILAYFDASKRKRHAKNWALQEFVRSSDRRLTGIVPPPDIATYFNDPSELLFDARKELRYNLDRLVEDNLHRFPESLRASVPRLQQIVEAAINTAKKRVRRSYKTAVPQFYRGRIQLLLPLALEDPTLADLALVVTREKDAYTASTVLRMDCAYANARVIARPDREWLKP